MNEMYDNTSGSKENSIIPGEIKKFNFGAFFLNWIWGLFNNTYIALATLIPFIGVFVAIYLGIKGNELAWKNKKWKSIEEFLETQRNWNIAGIVVFILLFGIILLF